MADTKITALTAITTVDPAADVLPIVDVSDTSMAASGTTKKITSNQILGAGGTATLASATISGDLTVDTNVLKVDTTNNRVGVNTASPATDLEVRANGTAEGTIRLYSVIDGSTASPKGSYFSFRSGTTGGGTETARLSSLNRFSNVLGGDFSISTADTSNVLQNRLTIDSGGVFTFAVGGSTAMTLNSTGLGVGSAPSGSFKITAAGSFAGILANKNAANQFLAFSMKNSTQDYCLYVDQDGVGSNSWSVFDNTNAQTAMRYYPGASGYWHFMTNNVERLRIDASGNVCIGQTPTTGWRVGSRALQLGAARFVSLWEQTNGSANLGFACYEGSSNVLNYTTTGDAPTLYSQISGTHKWLTAPSGTAGTAITFTQAMTLDSGGNLLVGTTTNTNSSRVFARGTGGATTLAIQSSTGDTANPGLIVGKFDNDSTTSQILVRFTINNNAAGSGQINANGASQAAFGTFSDSRLKENIVSLPSQLANILSLRPVEFDYKDGSGHQIGFVAQEMQEVYSDSVGEQNGFLTVTGWSKTEARLVSAIKELAAKVQALEAKLA